MKRMYLLMGVAVTLVALLVAGCAGGGGGGARTTITLDFGTFWPATDFQVTLGHKEWAKAISDRVMAETTNWTVAWNWYYSITPAALLTGVKAGTYDVMTSGMGYYAGVYPLWDGPYFAANLTRKNALQMSMAAQALWDTFTPLQTWFASLEPNIEVMHYWDTGPGFFLMVLGKNITQLSDFTGKKIRAADVGSNATIAALGGTGMYMPMSAALLAFQAGTIDGILCPTDTPKGFGLSAYVRSCTYAPFCYQFVFCKWMNKATYDGLPAEVQTIVDSVNAKYPEYYGKLRTWGELNGLLFCRSTLGWNVSWWEYNLPVANSTEYDNWIAACYPSLLNGWLGGNQTRIDLWGNFTEKMNYYLTTPPWSTWTTDGGDANPPPVPTFP